MNSRKITSGLVAAALTAVAAAPAWASYGFYVGRNLTTDGSVLLGGTGDEPSSHWLDTLTDYSSRRAADALSLGDALLGSIEARHLLLYGYRAPTGADMSTPGHRLGISVDCRGAKQ